jgi:3D (Asp-Asp-Asp) domain-containing protein
MRMNGLVFLFCLLFLLFPKDVRTSYSLAPTPSNKDIKTDLKNVNNKDKKISKKPVVSTVVASITAFNATKKQCGNSRGIGAWGDKVYNGIVAISRDLERGGLTRNKLVYIEGIGIKKVLDRTGNRIPKHLDVYYTSILDTRRFGKQKRKIYWIADLKENYTTKQEKEILENYAATNGSTGGIL